MKQLKTIERSDMVRYLMGSGLFDENTLNDLDDKTIEGLFETAVKCRREAQFERDETFSSLFVKPIRVFYEVSTTEITTGYDDNERPYAITKTENVLDVHIISHSDIYNAFSNEGGDGDDCGSFSKTIILVIDSSGKILYDSKANIIDYQKTISPNMR